MTILNSGTLVVSSVKGGRLWLLSSTKCNLFQFSRINEKPHCQRDEGMSENPIFLPLPRLRLGIPKN